MTDVPTSPPDNDSPDSPGVPDALPPGGLPADPQGDEVDPGTGRIDLNIGEDAGDIGDLDDQGDIAADDAGGTALAHRLEEQAS